MKRKSFFIITVFFLSFLYYSCYNADSSSESPDNKRDTVSKAKKNPNQNINLVDWVQENEADISFAIGDMVAKHGKMEKSSSIWISKSIVITEFDPSILGELAKKVKSIDNSLDVTFTFSSNSDEKPIIQMIPNDSSGYINQKWKSEKKVEMNYLILEYSNAKKFEAKKLPN
jgi:hypothetical protein